jgi:hypothetical protein
LDERARREVAVQEVIRCHTGGRDEEGHVMSATGTRKRNLSEFPISTMGALERLVRVYGYVFAAFINGGKRQRHRGSYSLK